MEESKLAAKSAPKSAKATATKPMDASLEAEEESAAARSEPMGSIAAAVPGDDALAQDAIETRDQPGAEATEIRDHPQTTAGTEEHVHDQ